ncbi:dCTP deaminase [Thermosipho sp. (in: thermotogales)]|jgi:dCTP deaminase|uniref:dCTP deaminase n=1 Tax=Thermosipho sp. (in: thermotogales) TaxID=1968895 RepID=UPI00257FE8AD|nr:dCTP deaminase [Thermosipho sp. (in: thermotogales)]MBZ4649249.1 dcd [Thermosipho sp. (in: thermotogales)]
MGVLSDRQIREYVERYKMIDPFEPKQVKEIIFNSNVECGEALSKIIPVISYGTSCYGYDLRAGNVFQVFTNLDDYVVDPKNFNPKLLFEKKVQPHEAVIIPPNSFALAVSVERFKIPRNIVTICMGKSTYARCGIIVNVTPFEPEWEGYPTLEISNTTPLPAKIYAYEGLAQVMFLTGDEVCEISYADKKGKYQNQENKPVPPKV